MERLPDKQKDQLQNTNCPPRTDSFIHNTERESMETSDIDRECHAPNRVSDACVNVSLTEDGPGPDISAFSPQHARRHTMDVVYKNIMQKKQEFKAEESNVHATALDSSAHRSITGTTSCSAVPTEGPSTIEEEQSFREKILRSSTMEDLDQLMKENQHLMFDLVGLLSPEEQQEIEIAKATSGHQDHFSHVKSLIRMYTMEKVFPQHSNAHGPMAGQDPQDGSVRLSKRPLQTSLNGRHGSLKHSGSGRGGSRLKQIKDEPSVLLDGEDEDGLLPRTRSQLVDLAEAAAALEDAEQRQREREQQEQQGRLMQQLINIHQQSNIMDVQAMKALQTKSERLSCENGALQSQLEMLQRHLVALEAENQAMKGRLLKACVDAGITADMSQLDQTIMMHQPPPVSDEQAAQLASQVLSKNKGSVGGTIQELIHTAISHGNDANHSQQRLPSWHPSAGLITQEGLRHANTIQLLHSQLQRQSSGLAAALLGGYDGVGGGMLSRSFLQNGALGQNLPLGQQSAFGALSGLHALLSQQQQQL